MAKLTAEQRIERTHVTLMRNPNFCLFSGVFMVGKVTVSDKEKTASTNGRDVTYGRSFVERLDDKELAFLVVHEAMHKAYRHLTTWQNLAKENARLANAAMDYVINLQIRDYDNSSHTVRMPRDENGNPMGLIDEQYRGMDTKQVYDILKKQCKNGGGKGKGKGDGKGESGGHSDDPSSSPEKGDGGEPNPSSFDEHDWDGAKELSNDEKEELGREIDHALREGAILAGKMKGNVPREINHILHPKVDWKEALRDFVKSHVKGADQSSWRRPNRKYLGIDVIMPSSISFRAERISIGADTSGSIDGDILSRFLGEAKMICDEVSPEIVDMMYWDTHVAKHEVYRDAEVNNFINLTKPAGGGGTNPDCVPKFLKDKQIKPQCIVMLTDGVFFEHRLESWQELGAPVLWCVVGNRDFKPIVGQSVCVE